MLLIVVILLVLAGTIVFTAYRTSYRPKQEPHVGNFVPSEPESSGSPSVRPPRPLPSKPRMPIRTASRTSNRPKHSIPNYTDDEELYAPGVAALDRMRNPDHGDSPAPSFDDSPSHDSSHSHDSSSHDSGGHDSGGSHD